MSTTSEAGRELLKTPFLIWLLVACTVAIVAYSVFHQHQRVEAMTPNIDIGLVSPNDTGRIVVHFENNGREPHFVVPFGTSSSGSFVRYDAMFLAPHSQASMEIIYKVPSNARAGPITWKFSLKSTDGSVVRINVRGTCRL